MRPLIKLLIGSSLLLTVLILFNVSGYYYVQRRTVQNEIVEKGYQHSFDQQLGLQQLSRKISVFAIHHYFSQEQSNNYISDINELIVELQNRQQVLTKLLEREELQPIARVDTMKADLKAASLNFNNIISFFRLQIADSAHAAQIDYAQQKAARTTEASYLDQMQKTARNFQLMESKIEDEMSHMNIWMLSSLYAALFLIASLVVVPILKSNIKNYKELQLSLDEVKRSESLLRTIINSSPDLIFILDRNEKYTVVNKALLQMTGHADIDEEEQDTRIKNLPGLDGLLQGNREVMNNGISYFFDEVKLDDHGSEKIIAMTKIPLHENDGSIRGILGFGHDITARVQAEANLSKSEKEYRHLFHSNPMPMWIFDLATYRFLNVNERAIQHYGYSREEFESMTIFDIRPNVEYSRLTNLVHKEKQEGMMYMHGQWRHIKKNGTEIIVEIISHKIVYNGKHAMLVLANDVTSNVQLQRELVQEKVARQKEITKATLSVQEKERHDIGKELHDNVNQILTSAKLHLEMIGQRENAHIDKSVELVSMAIQEIRRLSKSLVPPTFKDMGLISAIEDLVEHMNTLQKVNVQFLSESFDETMFDSDFKLTLFRIIQEQITNIVKYAAATQVIIELKQVYEQVHLSIKDNGQGFDLNKKRKGIGLSNIINRADVFEGKVNIDTAPGMGCCLSVNFKIKQIKQETFNSATE